MAKLTKASVRASGASDSALQEAGWSANADNLLYRFTDGLYRASSLSEIYEIALDAIAEGLGCARASILLMDGEGIMRFVAWRGLSEDYRKAVDGHSPWKRGDTDVDIICIEDIARTDQPESIKAAVQREGICGLAFIPLMASGDLTGKFMAYHDVARLFTARERELALTIARQLGFAIEKYRALQRAARYASIVESSYDVIVSKDLDGNILSWNDAATRLFGYGPDEVMGQSGAMLFPEDRADEEPRILAQVRAGAKVAAHETVRVGRDGRLIDISLTVSPILDEHGRIVGASKIARDITDKRRAVEQQQLMLREMNHRVKNLFAVASSLVQLCARSCSDADELARMIVDRLVALSRAHSLTMAQEDEEGGQGQTPLSSLFATILEPFGSVGEADDQRFTICGDAAEITAGQVTSLAMLIYELATNAAKYGGLSAPGGRVAIAIAETPEGIAITWEERGGPAIDASAIAQGFGHRLIEAASRQLGTIERVWAPDGLVVKIKVARLPARQPAA